MQKTSVRSVHGDKGFQVRGVGQIAAGFAADQNFFAAPLHFFQKQHPGASLGRPSGGHEPRRSAAHHNNIGLHRRLIHPGISLDNTAITNARKRSIHLPGLENQTVLC